MSMETTELTGDGIESVHVWQAYVMCAMTTVMFYMLGEILDRLGKPKFVAPEVEFWKWRNITISWIHGVICGTWVFLCLVLYPDLVRDPVAYINNFMYLMVPFSAGYFIYDTIDMKMNKKLGTYWEVTLHHFVIISSFIYNFNIRSCIGYNVIILMAEINTIFLHMRKLLQMCHVGFDTKLYRFVSFSNIFTFVTFRLIPILRVYSGLYLDFHRVSLTYVITFWWTITTGLVINLILFWRLVKSDILRGFSGKRKQKLDNTTGKSIFENGDLNFDKDE